VLFSIGQALRRAGRVCCTSPATRKSSTATRSREIEAAADVGRLVLHEAPGFAPGRPGDRSFVGNIVQAMRPTRRQTRPGRPIAFNAADRVIAIGSDRMMAAVAAARHGVLRLI